MTLLHYTGLYWKLCTKWNRKHIILLALTFVWNRSNYWMILIKIFNEGTGELLNSFQIHSEFVKQDFKLPCWKHLTKTKVCFRGSLRRINYALFELLIQHKPRLVEAVFFSFLKKRYNWNKDNFQWDWKLQRLCLEQQRTCATIISLHNNVSQNQHMKLMINHFLITKHREDNWKIPSGRGILKRYFCVYSTTGTNSEAEVPGGPVCLLQNWFTKAECTSTQSEAHSRLLPPWKSTAEVS